MIVAVVVTYLTVLVVIGIWGGRGTGSIKGYFLADKDLPSWVVAFSSNATGESAWLLLGLTGMGYAVGVHAFWVVLGEVAGVALAWRVVAPRFKEYTDRYESITVPDFLESHFGDRGHAFRVIGAIVIVTMAVAYTSAQLTASGKAFQSFVGTSYTAGVLFGAAVILFYTTVGGFKAVAYSDLLQGILMLAGLLVMPVVGMIAAGGWSGVTTALAAADPDLLSLFGEHGFSTVGVMSALSFLGIGLAFLGAPQLLTRFMSARDQRAIRSGGYIATACMIGFDVGAVLTGMAGRALFPTLADPETVLPNMAVELFPAIFAGIFLVIVLAAIMSTVDSILILASSAVVRDLSQQVFGAHLTEERFTAIGKVTTLVLGVVALMFAFGEGRLLFWFILFAWSGLGAAFAPPVLAAILWKRTTRNGALAAMIVGFVTTVAWILWFKDRFFNLYEMIPGFGLAILAVVVVSLLERRS